MFIDSPSEYVKYLVNFYKIYNQEALNLRKFNKNSFFLIRLGHKIQVLSLAKKLRYNYPRI